MPSQKRTSEKIIHEQIAQYLNVVLDERAVWTSVEVSNQQGGKAGQRKQVALKRKGVMTGWPDIQLLWNDGGLKGLCLEVKNKRGKTTAAQVKCHFRLAEINIPTEVVRSVDDVRDALKKHNVPNREKIYDKEL